MATKATGVTELHPRAPRIDRQALAARLAEDLNQAIVNRHNVGCRRGSDIHTCTDALCSAFSALMLAVA